MITPDDVRTAEVKVCEAKARKIDSQRKQAWVAFGIGTFILLATAILPVLGSLAPLFNWGCKSVTIDQNVTLVCADPKAPWGFTAGLLAGLGLYLAAAAFRQVAVGEVGKRWLEKLPGFGKK